MRPVKTVSSVLDLGKGRLENCLRRGCSQRGREETKGLAGDCMERRSYFGQKEWCSVGKTGCQEPRNALRDPGRAGSGGSQSWLGIQEGTVRALWTDTLKTVSVSSSVFSFKWKSVQGPGWLANRQADRPTDQPSGSHRNWEWLG